VSDAFRNFLCAEPEHLALGSLTSSLSVPADAIHIAGPAGCADRQRVDAPQSQYGCGQEVYVFVSS
jgi:hypothetical protein